MFTPHAVAWSKVVDSSQEVEVVKWNLLGLDTKLMIQLALGCSTST
jgi:hypothetical protein